MAKSTKGGKRGGKKEKKNIPHAVAHIRATWAPLPPEATLDASSYELDS